MAPPLPPPPGLFSGVPGMLQNAAANVAYAVPQLAGGLWERAQQLGGQAHSALQRMDLFNNFGGGASMAPLPGYLPTNIGSPFARGHSGALRNATLMHQMQSLSQADAVRLMTSGLASAGAGVLGTAGGAVVGGAIGSHFGATVTGAELGATVGGVAGGFLLNRFRPFHQGVGMLFGGTVRDMVGTGQLMGQTNSFVRTGGQLDASGRGLNMQSAHALLRSFDDIASNSQGSLTRRDVMDMSRVAADQGLLDDVQNVDQIAKAVKNITKLAAGFAKITGDPDWRNNVRLMGQLRTSGVDADDMLSMLRTTSAYGAMAGQDVRTTLANAEATGYRYRQAGFSRAAGLEAGALAQGMTALIEPAGALTDRQMDRFGGAEGVANSLTEMGLNFLTRSDQLLPYLAVEGADGKMRIDPGKLGKLRRGEVDLDTMIQEGASATRDPRVMEKLTLAIEDLRDEMAKGLGASGTLSALTQVIKDVSQKTGTSFQGAATQVLGDRDMARLLTQLFESGKLGAAMSDQLGVEQERLYFEARQGRRAYMDQHSDFNRALRAAGEPGVQAVAAGVGGGLALLGTPLAPLVAPAAMAYGAYQGGSEVYNRMNEAGTEWYLRQQGRQQADALGRTRIYLGAEGLSGEMTGHAADVFTRGMSDDQLVAAMRRKPGTRFRGLGISETPTALDLVTAPLDTVRTALTGRSDEERSYLDQYISGGSMTPAALAGMLGGRNLSGGDAFLLSPFAGARLLSAYAGAEDRYNQAAKELQASSRTMGAALEGKGGGQGALEERIFRDLMRYSTDNSDAGRAAARRKAAELAQDYGRRLGDRSTVLGMQSTLSVGTMSDTYAEVLRGSMGEQAAAEAALSFRGDEAALTDAFGSAVGQDVTGTLTEAGRRTIELEMGRDAAASRSGARFAGRGIDASIEMMEDATEFYGMGGLDMDSEKDVSALRQLFTGDDSSARAVLQIATAQGDWFSSEGGMKRLAGMTRQLAAKELATDPAFQKLSKEEQEKRIQARARAIQRKAMEMYKSAGAETRSKWTDLGRSLNLQEGASGDANRSMETLALLREGTERAVPAAAAMAQLKSQGFDVDSDLDDRGAGRAVAQQWAGLSEDAKRDRLAKMRAAGKGKLAARLEGLKGTDLSDADASQLFLDAVGGAGKMGHVDSASDPLYTGSGALDGTAALSETLRDVANTQSAAAGTFQGGVTKFDASVNKFARVLEQLNSSDSLAAFNNTVPKE